MVLLMASRQRVGECLNASQTACFAGGVSHLGGVGSVRFCDPHIHHFPMEGISARQTASFTPTFRLPKVFPDKKLGNTTIQGQLHHMHQL